MDYPASTTQSTPNRWFYIVAALVAGTVSVGFAAQPSGSSPTVPSAPELGPASTAERNGSEGCIVVRSQAPGQPEVETVLCSSDD